jgi:superfamily II DNA or RNA helicase
MSTKFFTNAGENTLLNKFDGIFKYTSVHAFDALVGYFRSSGYFRIRKHLDNVSEIRILVGIDVDHLINEAAKKGLEFNFNTDVTREEYLNELRLDIQEADYTKDVEEGILQFINDIITGKIQIKAHPDKNIHAKIYIFTPKVWNEHNSGSVITGSSNLSISGIEKNFEFNVELRDYDDVAFAKKTFEALWLEAIDMLPSQFEDLKKNTYLNDTFTPFELYIKLLIEYFGNSIEYDPESITDLPKGYKKLAYQIDAVNDGFNKLMQHNGFILADVVGLGKTLIATIIAKKFYFSNGYRTKTLIVIPPAMEIFWRRTIHDFDIPNVDFITNGSIHKVAHPDDFDLIIVDEAHKFRSDESEMFHQLQKLCKTPRKRQGLDGSTKKKIILVTATPLNNHPEDIRNQLYLFQDSKQSTLEVSNGNLQHFFRPLIEDYNKLKKEKDHSKIKQGVKKIYDEIRIKILEPIIVRRTRTDIRNTPTYWKDILAQGLKFPDIVPPKQILYQLDSKLNDLYDSTLRIIKDTKNGLGYYRYQAIKFLNAEAKAQYKKVVNINENQAMRISEQLAHIIRILLVKRIDSSFQAFKMSLKRYHDANKAMVMMIENNRIYIAPKLKVSEYMLNEDEQYLEDLLPDTENAELIQVFTKEDFEEEFISGIYNDQQILEKLVASWKQIDYDPKYDTFIDKLKNELLNPQINPNKKIIVFSESKETTDYLFKRLKEDRFEKVLCVDSSNQKDLSETIYENFDANASITNQKSDFDIVITTEVLAEGINLHRSNFVLNYDIPWNATRLMQRIGRVNRIGTPSSKIYIYNFFPTIQTDNEIELNKKAYMKLQAFHSALGEDSQIYSNQEEYDSFGLFEQIPEEEKDERLEYLNFLRKFRDESPEIYKHIKNRIPTRSRSGRKNKSSKGQTIAYIKNKKRDSFYLIFQDLKLDELTFVEAVRIFKAEISERPTGIHELHYDQINIALNAFNEVQNISNLGDKASVKLGPNEQRALAFITKFANSDLANDNEIEWMELAKSAIRRGKFQKLHREIVKLIKDQQKAGSKTLDVFNTLINILKSYPLMQAMEEEHISLSEKLKSKAKVKHLTDLPQIIISESFTA